MRQVDRDCYRLAEIQAKLFEQSISQLHMGSEIFVRRFMNSEIAKELDSKAFLDGTETIFDIFDSLDDEYGKTTYGTVKYHRDVMYWCGYLYRCFCYHYEVSSKQAYRLFPLKYIASTYEVYHTLDVFQAIERLLESKNISLGGADFNKKGLEILRKMRLEKA